MTQNSDQGISLDGVIRLLTTHSNFPTFDEFRKNPNKWRERPEEIFEAADKSSLSLRDSLKRQVYFWRDTHQCESLEQVERIAREEGYGPQDLAEEPRVRPMHGSTADHDMEVVIRFWPKFEFKLRGGVVFND